MAENAWVGWMKEPRMSYKRPTGPSRNAKPKKTKEQLQREAGLRKVRNYVEILTSFSGSGEKRFGDAIYKYRGMLNGYHTWQIEAYNNDKRIWVTFWLSSNGSLVKRP